jgi:biopolymer transport protein ExbD
MRRRRARMPVDPPEINLVPLLDMVSLLIQLMLVTAQFGAYAELPSTAAAQGAGSPDAEALTLVVRPTLDGFSVQWREGDAAAPVQARDLPCATTPCDAPEDYDGHALRELAASLRSGHPGERQVLVQPARGVPFEVVVRTMDLLRLDEDGRPLFPDVLFSGSTR